MVGAKINVSCYTDKTWFLALTLTPPGLKMVPEHWSGLDDIREIIKCKRLGLFGHVAHLQPRGTCEHLFSQPAVLQVTTLLLNVAGAAHVVDAASAGFIIQCICSVPITR